jgi:hypothetical protein
MTIQLNKNLGTRIGLALAMALASWSPAQAQSGEAAKAKKTMMEGSKMDHSQMEHSKVMMERCQGMMADMKAQDTELTLLVGRMNSATGEARVDLMAEIITQMTEQRAAMNAKMASMQMEMMKHMQMGMGSKPHHPSMKGMGQKTEEPPKANK